MAAEFLLTFTIEETLKKVISIAAEGISFAWGLEDQLRRLSESLTTIQAKLEDAARRHVTDKSVKLWLERLQDVAYEAEDVLDEDAYEILRKDQEKGKEGDFFSFDTLITHRLSMGPKVKKINEALDEIWNDAAAIGLVSTSLKHEDKAQEVWRDLDRETDSFLDKFVGRDDDGLEEWMVPGGEGDQVFPCLEKLRIEGCGKLKSILICGLSSLVEFEIEGCGELRCLSGEFDGFKSLQMFRIEGCGKLESIPSVQHCTSLVKLMIEGCPKLISIPGDFGELKYSLKELVIESCKLGALPSGLQCCASLEELWINNCGELMHINDLQELSSLRILQIESCDKLISIDWHGLRQLRSLVELDITECRSLSDFPEEDCMGSLNQLRELRIGGFSGELFLQEF